MKTFRIPISVVTGFLGSGKTTLLASLLTHPQMSRTAVLVNEFGEMGIDDVLLRQVSANVVLLESGCLCCAIGDDLSLRLLELLGQRDARMVPSFERVIIETTGLADPVPVLQRFMVEPLVAAPLRMASVITTVDAVYGERQLDEHVELLRQAGVADRLLVTKTDIVEPQVIELLVARLKEINPTAALYPIVRGEIEPDLILDSGLLNTQTGGIDTERWLKASQLTGRASAARRATSRGLLSQAAANDRHWEIDTFCIRWRDPIKFEAFADVMEKLIAEQGDHLLRIKGIVDVEDYGAVAVQGVQKMFYPPARLGAWPEGKRGSAIVFITQNIERGLIEKEFSMFSPQGAFQATAV